MDTHVYLISYDLTRPGQDYSGLIQKIKECGSWWHPLESAWLVSTSLTARQLHDRLSDSIDPNDKLLIINVGGDYHGRLAPQAWTWIARHVNDNV